jgi:Ca2+-binding EF-hand superfamily protein
VKELLKGIDNDGSGSIDFNEFLQLINMKKKINEENPDFELKNAFDVFDLNGDGEITIEELGKVLNNIGQNLSQTQINEMMKQADINKDGLIDFDEFKKMMSN